MILNFLAAEGRLSTQHIDCIWAAAQVHPYLRSCAKKWSLAKYYYANKIKIWKGLGLDGMENAFIQYGRYTINPFFWT